MIDVYKRQGLIQHDAFQLHSQHAGNGDPLLLAAGEQMGRVAGELAHAHRRQGVVHPLPDLPAGNPQVLRGEGHVLLHHVGHDLVVRVLEHHAHRPADGQQQMFVQGVHSLHIHMAPAGQQNTVERLGQGGLAGSVVAQHHHDCLLYTSRCV